MDWMASVSIITFGYISIYDKYHCCNIVTWLFSSVLILGLKLKDAAKKLGKKFASGCSIVKDGTGVDTLVIQGDVSYELGPFLVTEMGIPKDKVRIAD